ncbi:hypothetical protein [Nitrososphaera sp.]|uniref:hypothetical protein n=1 Tax=Nitrososphaera sp. TaxID=1971748 RepID=UPI0017CE974F|nr:hypothetical protein [Nitrososphaera sp.]NWG36531.1 hypothetical protein [Nitrososphaera sp.]
MLRQHTIVIDADASPSGYIAWYNHHTESSKIMSVRPALKNERFGVQRMELLAIYFALRDNLVQIRRTRANRKRLVIQVRSDSKSTVEQLRGIAEIRDLVMRRIVFVIGKLLAKIGLTTIVFDHLERSRNIAGLMLEQRRRKEREKAMEMASLYRFAPLPLCA